MRDKSELIQIWKDVIGGQRELQEEFEAFADAIGESPTPDEQTHWLVRSVRVLLANDQAQMRLLLALSEYVDFIDFDGNDGPHLTLV